MNLRETLLDAAQHFLVPIDLQIGMQAALHQHAGAAEFDGLANLVVDGVELEDVTLFGCGPLQRPVESAEGAILGAEIRVIDVAVDDVGGDAFGCSLRRTASASMPMPIRSSERNKSRACCLVRDIGTKRYEDSNGVGGQCQT